MKCFYINLDKSINRKINIENNFLENNTSAWTLTRFSAIDVMYVENNKIEGALRANEKACFLSHKFVIKENINCEEPILVMEDDAIFGKSTCAILDNFIKGSDKFEWDILFTDVGVGPEVMLDLINLRKRLSINQENTLLDLAKLQFFGATSYILNPKSLKKVFNLLDENVLLNIPYDLYLRSLIRKQY